MRKTLESIALSIGGRLAFGSDIRTPVTKLFTDSREVSQNGLFLALRGEKTNGNDFVPEVLKKGCFAIIDDEKYFVKNTIAVTDVRSALQSLAEGYRLHELANIPVVGITGSVGKTTAKDITACALSQCIKVHKTKGNANSQVGLPISVLDTPEDVDVAVLEMGVSIVGEMDRIARTARPNIAIITGIGHTHLETMITRDTILREKLKILDYSSDDSVYIINGDDELLRSFKTEKTVYTVSQSDSSCDCFAYDIKQKSEELCFKASVFGREVNVCMPVTGAHFINSALFALATAYLLKADVQKAADALSDYQSDGMRQHIYEKDGVTIIDDCYNAAPESVKAALDVLTQIAKGRRIAVLGDMLELGEDSRLLHEQTGEYAIKHCDLLVTFGERARDMAKSSDVNTKSFTDIDELKNYLQSEIKKGDTVLYKASNGMKLRRAVV